MKSCAFGPDLGIDLAKDNFIIHKLYAISLASANPDLKFMILPPFGTRRKTIVMSKVEWPLAPHHAEMNFGV